MNHSNTNKFDLSLGQEALWFIHAMGGNAESAYNESLVYSIQGYVSVAVLKQAFERVIEKHALLQTAFEKDEEGSLFQVLKTKISFDFSVTDHVFTSNEDEHRHIAHIIKRPFDFSNPPLLRVELIKKNELENILVIVMHHIITDGTSFSILIKDLVYFYNKLLRDDKTESHVEENSYFNHVHLEKKKFSTQEYEHQTQTLADTLKEFSSLNFLTTPIGQNNIDLYSGNRVYFHLAKDLFGKISVYCQENRTTVFNFLYSAYALFLSQYTRSEDILIGIPFANRENDPTKSVIGYFVNTLPSRIRVDKNEKFSVLLKKVQKHIFSFLGKQGIAFEHTAPKLNLERKSSQHPLIQTIFVWASVDKLKLTLEGVSAQLEKKYFANTSKFDLSLFMLEENKDTITSYFEYRDALFDKAMVERMANGFGILIKNILSDPENVLSSFSMIDSEEENRMKREFFTSKLDRVVTTSLAQLFSQSARQNKNHIGLVSDNKHYDYQTIELKSNQWASYIRNKYRSLYGKEMPGDTLIGLCVDRNEDMIFGMLGILKAGAAYVPIDPHYPQERINYIIEHSKASLLLTHTTHNELNFNFQPDHIVYMNDTEVQTSSAFLNIDLNHAINPKDTAYVLYTSGSTGKPKGVSVTHENVICLFESLKKQFQISNNDVWSLFHTFCFDISVWEIWGAFLFGGTLVIVPYETARNPKELYKLLEKNNVTVLTQTASAFQMLINEDMQLSKKLSSLRYVGFVGESLKVSILRPWVEKYGTEFPKLVNLYGITETTVYTNYKFIDQTDIDKGRDNIGWPLEEFSMCVMDENLRWCPVGIVGEICIGGRGLSRGYLYRDDLTQEKFILDPYADFLGLEKGSLIYRTGDLGRWMNDGSIEYLGRKDFQIKLRGFRIELGEIESALGSYEGISHTTVLLKGSDDAAYLAAYYTVKSNHEVNVDQLLSHLKSFLPDYMVPKTFIELKSFPMTMNGKVDRKELLSYEDKRNIEKKKSSLNTLLEYEIANIWAEILSLDIDEINSLSNFFELGGNSLLVIRMLTQVSKKINKDLSLSQFIATPTFGALSKMGSDDVDLKQNALLLLERIQNDSVLDPIIEPLKDSNPYVLNPNNILVTGATGFLGSHMLRELLEKKSSTIYCLVRASTEKQGLSKIIEKLKKYHLYSDEYIARIIPVLGDLNQAALGLSNDDYRFLTQEIDSIYHIGASVHHIFDYQMLSKTNVESIRDIIRMAVIEKNKSVHFISTLATQLISPLEKLNTVSENTMESYLNMNGYLTTKWVAEQLLKEAYSRGIIAHTYRPGNIIAGSKGIYEPEMNHTLLRLKGMLQLEKAYIGNHEIVEMMPVDLLSSAIVEVSSNPPLHSYNMNNNETISWFEYLTFAKNRKYRIDFLSDKNEWNEIINNLSEDNSLYKFSHLYKAHPQNNETNHTNECIKPDYIIFTPTYKEMIDQQLSILIKDGFLSQPDILEKITA